VRRVAALLPLSDPTIDCPTPSGSCARRPRAKPGAKIGERAFARSFASTTEGLGRLKLTPLGLQSAPLVGRCGSSPHFSHAEGIERQAGISSRSAVAR
jgi:hypothetical protein